MLGRSGAAGWVVVRAAIGNVALELDERELRGVSVSLDRGSHVNVHHVLGNGQVPQSIAGIPDKEDAVEAGQNGRAELT